MFYANSISGDKPLVLLRITAISGIDLVRQLVLAHAYWRMKGLTVELIILNEDLSVYRQSVHDEIVNLISSGIEAPFDKSALNPGLYSRGTREWRTVHAWCNMDRSGFCHDGRNRKSMGAFRLIESCKSWRYTRSGGGLQSRAL